MPSAPQWPDDERRQLALVLERSVAGVVGALAPAGEAGATDLQPLAVLLAAVTASGALDDATSFAVARARDAGHTWQEIGELLAISRQAAQQRFGDRAGDRPEPEHAALAQRASEIVGQIDRGEWATAAADWNGVMHSELSLERLETVWHQITATAGSLQGVGRPTVKHKGPFRIAEVPLVFEHGPMRATVTFDHDDKVAGLFLRLPEEA
ncbi:MAG TPA: DUF3887 domain-containing protein [Solirubrobacteraceae bacterium]|jgi:hypothetical protein|nr:DUF3887 domain-containing protein [Solirubrobacteraceae bacterium]